MKVQLKESQSQQEMMIPSINPSPSTNVTTKVEVTSTKATTTQKTPEDSRKLIQKQLVLLLHSHACQKKDYVIVGNSPEDHPRCTVPNCEMMKEVWVHIKACRVGPDCSHLHCLSSLKILAHWKHCQTEDCPVCHLVRLKYRQSAAAASNKANAENASANTIQLNSPDQQEEQFNETAGQSTRELTQGQSQCQGQQLTLEQHEQQQGSGFNENCQHYHYPPQQQTYYNNTPSATIASHEDDSCHVQPHQYQYQQHYHHNQQPTVTLLPFQQYAGAALEQYVNGLLNNSEFDNNNANSNDNNNNQNYEEYQSILTPPQESHFSINNNMMFPSQFSQPVLSHQHKNHPHHHIRKSHPYLNLKNCQCGKCRKDGKMSGNSINIPQETHEQSQHQQHEQIGMKNLSMMIMRSQAQFEQPNDETSNPNAVPSASDVRRAYEQLGIPCPTDALKRLMATLPGGSKENEIGSSGIIMIAGQEGYRFSDDQEVPNNSEDDDGINVEYIAQDDDEKAALSAASWCLSLVQRLTANGQGRQISAVCPPSSSSSTS